jgi:adenylate cyclase
VTATAACRTCGTEPREAARFCDGCGAPIAEQHTRAEYKQVTVLFADVVHSMDIAAAVGAERLREIMTELVNRASEVVQRCGGTVDKFTGDGIMALFGAPVALEDHAVRACLSALGIQEHVSRLAAGVKDRDGIDLRLRVGLNSGQVITGEIGSGAARYTAVGAQVGMAQRMESVAPPGGVMLSASTARLVEHSAVLDEPELVRIKGAEDPIQAQRLLAVKHRDHAVIGAESALVGRHWETAAADGLLGRAIDGHGAVLAVAGPAGIGKSRLVHEVTALAAAHGVEVFRAYCESHTSGAAFHVVVRLLRAVTGVGDLDASAARARIRSANPVADPEDLLLFEDLLGVADPGATLPKIDPDARRRRLTALINTASLSRRTPAVYVIEDAHWIDEASESMLADFLAVIPRTASLVMITYRPEYGGALSKINGTQTITLAPLSDLEIAALVTELLGPDSSAAGVATLITNKAAGNPFFAEEMVRDLAERGVLDGKRGGYHCGMDVADVRVPATLQAALAARIDRLNQGAKRTLNAAAVIGLRLDADLLTSVVQGAEVEPLIEAELVDRVMVGSRIEYAFRHPLICAAAYESQLKSDRAELHRRLAEVIQQLNPASADDNAEVIAEHLEAAGEPGAAYSWHMRAAYWLMGRDVAAARSTWARARRVADALPPEYPDRTTLRIHPRTMLCSTAWRVGDNATEAGLDELRLLCTTSGNRASLAAGLSGATLSLTMGNRNKDAARLATEQIALFDTADDPMSVFAVMTAAMFAKLHAGEVTEALRVAQAVIDLVAGDGSKGSISELSEVLAVAHDWGLGSPLAIALLYRAQARAVVGDNSWRADLKRSIAMQRDLGQGPLVIVITYGYSLAVTNGLLLSDAAALAETADVLHSAEKSGDGVALALAQVARGLVLTHAAPSDQSAGVELLATGRQAQVLQRNLLGVALVDIRMALLKADAGDLDDAITTARATVDELTNSGEMVIRGAAIAALVTGLLMRSSDTDVYEAQAFVDRLADVPTEPGFVMNDVWLQRLRALLARARGDETGYRDHRDRYLAMARTCGFEGHVAWAEAMP